MGNKHEAMAKWTKRDLESTYPFLAKPNTELLFALASACEMDACEDAFLVYRQDGQLYHYYHAYRYDWVDGERRPTKSSPDIIRKVVESKVKRRGDRTVLRWRPDLIERLLNELSDDAQRQGVLARTDAPVA